jgi:acyl-CoA synthetase (AMP-forming)/AMP-acid ligase II
VGSLAWNGFRHLELFYGVSGSGAVLHAINPRLALDDIAAMNMATNSPGVPTGQAL